MQAQAGGSPIGWSRHSRTADAINWNFCRSSAALMGWPLPCRSQIKLMYGSHHQQPQKDCRYDELDPLLVVREPSMHMIEPIHGQPPSGYPCSPEPNTLSHPRSMTDHRAEPMAVCYAPLVAGPFDCSIPRTGPGSPWLTRAGGSPIRDEPCHTVAHGSVYAPHLAASPTRR